MFNSLIKESPAFTDTANINIRQPQGIRIIFWHWDMFLAFPTSSLKETTKPTSKPPSFTPPALIPSRISLTGSITHRLPLAESNGSADVATAALPHASSLCPKAAHCWLRSKVNQVYATFNWYSYSGATFLSAGKHKRPASVTVCAVLNVKNRRRVLKPKFHKTLLRPVMTSIN